MSDKYFEGVTPTFDGSSVAADHPLRKLAEGIYDRYAACMEKMDYVGAKNIIMELVHAANHYIEDAAPWTVAKDPERASELAEISIRCLSLSALRTSLYAIHAYYVRRGSASYEP